jgi:hypothetical protein
VITDAPWAARHGHTSVIDAAGAIYVIGGRSNEDGRSTHYKDVWVSTDGGVRPDSVRRPLPGAPTHLGPFRSSRTRCGCTLRAHSLERSREPGGAVEGHFARSRSNITRYYGYPKDNRQALTCCTEGYSEGYSEGTQLSSRALRESGGGWVYSRVLRALPARAQSPALSGKRDA